MLDKILILHFWFGISPSSSIFSLLNDFFGLVAIGPAGDAAARGGAGAITGSVGFESFGTIIVVGIVLYSLIFVIVNIFEILTGIFGRDREKVRDGFSGLILILGCLVMLAAIVFAILWLNHQFFS